MDNYIQNFIHIPKLKFWGVIIVKIIFGNSYIVETLQGDRLPRALNGRYLKKYYPSVSQDA